MQKLRQNDSINCGATKESCGPRTTHISTMLAQDGHVEDMRQLVILPSFFTGGLQYMHKWIQDLLMYMRYCSYLDLFITLTCNLQWK